MTNFRAFLKEELGEELYVEGDDIENLLKYALRNGAPVSCISVTPKAHSTGMRLISVLSLNLVLMTSTLESVMSCYNQQQSREDSTSSETKFADIILKGQEMGELAMKKILVACVEGDFSGFNRNINPNDLFDICKHVIKTIYPENSGLSILVDVVQQ